MLDRALEIATDFVNAASPEHPAVRSLVATNLERISQLDDTSDIGAQWQASAAAIFELAQRTPEAPWVREHTAAIVAGTQLLADSLGMNWLPPPVLRPKQSPLDSSRPTSPDRPDS